jgi:hypothetical protein
MFVNPLVAVASECEFHVAKMFLLIFNPYFMQLNTKKLVSTATENILTLCIVAEMNGFGTCFYEYYVVYPTCIYVRRSKVRIKPVA